MFSTSKHFILNNKEILCCLCMYVDANHIHGLHVSHIHHSNERYDEYYSFLSLSKKKKKEFSSQEVVFWTTQ